MKNCGFTGRKGEGKENDVSEKQRKKPEQGIFGTGHHSVLPLPGKDEWRIVYHRFKFPDAVTMGRNAGFHREVCIDKLEFDENGRLQFKTEALEADARYDEIGSGLKIKQLQQDKKELLESLEMYYKVFFLGDIPEEELKKTSGSEG